MNNENFQSPNYYAIIPANVRYCRDLSAQEKLLYGEITSLSNFKGYCWATNEYFSKLYNLEIRSIQRQISSLVKHGFLKIDMVFYDDSKQIKERRIYLSECDVVTPPDKNVMTPPDKNVMTPPDKNVMTPPDKNVMYNNINNNITSINKESEREAPHTLTQKTYGEFQLVNFSNDEYAKLVEDYGQAKTDDYIAQLDSYMHGEGKQYKSHYATIKRWIKRDEKKVAEENKGTKPNVSKSNSNRFANFSQRDWDEEQLEKLEQLQYKGLK